MDWSIISLAFAAGLVAALNPCGFAMLPGYLALVVAGGRDRSRSAALLRAVMATAVMAVGFVLVFGLFALVIAPISLSVQKYLPYATVVIGVALALMGAVMLTGRELRFMVPKMSASPSEALGSMFGYGIAYAVASLSCTIGPFLAVTFSTFRSDSVWAGILSYVAYAAGMTVLVGVLAVSAALASSGAVGRARALMPIIGRVGGAVMVLTGLYVAYYGVIELRTNFGGASASDPIVDAFIGVQSVVSRAAGRVPGWVWGVAAIVLVTGAAIRLRRTDVAQQEGVRDAADGDA
ncbi:MAG: cytochrome c biogenesis CcdA family protein [Aeromicrobium sp.]